MSYDLFFRGRNSSAQLPLEEFRAYFKKRPSVEVEDAQACYSNERTGVYFSFDYGETEGDPDGRPHLPVAFNVNFFRPHTFGLEAQLEVARFVKHFDLTVVDPQTNGMGEGEYSKEGFLRGWNAGNEFAYRVLVERNPTANYASLPSGQLEAVWAWNYTVPRRQRDLGDQVFVPRVYFVAMAQGPPRTMLVWGDGIPILLPEVDLYLIPRKQLAPKPLPASAKSDTVLVSRAELAGVLSDFKHRADALACCELFYEHTPAEIVDFVRSAKKPAEDPQMLAFDQVLTRELLERARKPRA